MQVQYKIGPIAIKMTDPDVGMNVDLKIETVEITVNDVNPEDMEKVSAMVAEQLDTVFSNIAEGMDIVDAAVPR